MSLSNAESKLAAMQDRITALTAQLEDADARINELDALLREWSSGAKVKGLEVRLAEEARVRGLLVEALGRAYYYLPEPTTIEEAERGGRPIHFAVSRALAAADALDKERG